MNDTKILPSNEYTEFEDRVYLSPNLQVDETNTFIDNLRNIRNNNIQEIAQQTQALGTDVPSSLGGLTGAGSYFTSRYATPQSSSVAQNLRTTAQAAALNQALANEQAMWKKRYNDAYRSQQKRSWNKSTSGGSNGNNNNGNESTWNGDVKNNATNLTAADTFTLDSNTSGDYGEGIKWVANPATFGENKMEFFRIDTTKDVNDPEYQTLYRQQDDGNLVRVR